MHRIITQEEWQELEEGVLQLIELCETLKRANQRLEDDNRHLREEKTRLQALLGEAEARLRPVLEQLRALESQI
ncbi:MAG: hypothetical protein P3W87_003325 [Gammaproteobacteria bacterium]|nr:hypothetical protein [Gammaproteobacteria bacterium]